MKLSFDPRKTLTLKMHLLVMWGIGGVRSPLSRPLVQERLQQFNYRGQLLASQSSDKSTGKLSAAVEVWLCNHSKR